MNTTNKNITFKGEPLTIVGRELKVGDSMPAFTLTAQDMSDFNSSDLKGKVVVLSIVPSLDTPVCSTQTKRFNSEALDRSDDAVLLTVSMDLPFAQKRWCQAEEIEGAMAASDYKHRNFGEPFGVLIKEWGLFTRAVLVVDKNGTIQHIEYVQEVSSEPDYDAALAAVRQLS